MKHFDSHCNVLSGPVRSLHTTTSAKIEQQTKRNASNTEPSVLPLQFIFQNLLDTHFVEQSLRSTVKKPTWGDLRMAATVRSGRILFAEFRCRCGVRIPQQSCKSKEVTKSYQKHLGKVMSTTEQSYAYKLNCNSLSVNHKPCF